MYRDGRARGKWVHTYTHTHRRMHMFTCCWPSNTHSSLWYKEHVTKDTATPATHPSHMTPFLMTEVGDRRGHEKGVASLTSFRQVVILPMFQPAPLAYLLKLAQGADQSARTCKESARPHSFTTQQCHALFPECFSSFPHSPQQQLVVSWAQIQPI